MEKRKSKMGSYLNIRPPFLLEEIVAAFKHFESQKHFGSRVFDGRFSTSPSDSGVHASGIQVIRA
jgi:hypothetical protein